MALLQIARVALDLPLRRLFDYRIPEGESLTRQDIGYRVRVPFAQQQKIGVLVDVLADTELAPAQLKTLGDVLRDLPPLPASWFRLTEFCAAYYHVPLGQVMLSTLPAGLRTPMPRKPTRRRQVPATGRTEQVPVLTGEQEASLQAIASGGTGFRAYLLHGVTGEIK